MKKEEQPIIIKEIYDIDELNKLKIEPQGRIIKIFVNDKELHFVKSFCITLTGENKLQLIIERFFMQEDFDEIKKYYQ